MGLGGAHAVHMRTYIHRCVHKAATHHAVQAGGRLQLILDGIDWDWVASRMKTRSAVQCREKWWVAHVCVCVGGKDFMQCIKEWMGGGADNLAHGLLKGV